MGRRWPSTPTGRANVPSMSPIAMARHASRQRRGAGARPELVSRWHAPGLRARGAPTAACLAALDAGSAHEPCAAAHLAPGRAALGRFLVPGRPSPRLQPGRPPRGDGHVTRGRVECICRPCRVGWCARRRSLPRSADRVPGTPERHVDAGHERRAAPYGCSRIGPRRSSPGRPMAARWPTTALVGAHGRSGRCRSADRSSDRAATARAWRANRCRVPLGTAARLQARSEGRDYATALSF